MIRSLFSTIFALASLLQSPLVQSFAPSFLWPSRRRDRIASSSSRLYNNNKATLTPETVWKIRFVLKGVETEKGKKVDEIIRIDANFVEEEGYEPPQGSVKQLPSSSGSDGGGDRLKITKSYWQLSEDPNDRKGKIGSSSFSNIVLLVVVVVSLSKLCASLQTFVCDPWSKMDCGYGVSSKVRSQIAKKCCIDPWHRTIVLLMLSAEILVCL